MDASLPRRRPISSRATSVPGSPRRVLPENYNVAPTTDIYAVVDGPNGRELAVFHWGLVPVWAKDIKIGNRMINARSETVATSNAFKHALKKKRCIIPVDGFYEWKATPGEKRKQPYFIHRLDGEPLAFAGLWETWRGRGSPGRADALLVHDHHDDRERDDVADPRPHAGDPPGEQVGRVARPEERRHRVIAGPARPRARSSA